MDSLQIFIDTLHRVHLDNCRQYYSAKTIRGRARPIMPATPFVFEFFIYNSIYQIDWKESAKSGKKEEHPLVVNDEGKTSRITEGKQQLLLEKFLKEKCKNDPTLLARSFAPLAHLRDLEGEWTRILTNSKEKGEEENDFFRRIGELGKMVSQEALEPSGRVFGKIGQCRRFVYGVRCNIFHGSKSMAAFEDKGQCRRIEVYELFLQCLVSLFFLAWNKTPVACDEVQIPVEVPTFYGPPKIISPCEILRHVALRMMKPEDSRLIYRVQSMFGAQEHVVPHDGAMFYPSSGKDIITPVLIGLPVCTDFYFYDKSESRIPKSTTVKSGRTLGPDPECVQSLRRLLDVSMTRSQTTWSFEFNGVERRIHLVQAENMTFLNSGRTLSFFFRRGDSQGEGGSDQRWDEELFPEWRKMIPAGGHCIVLTDGEPGGLGEDLFTKLERIDFPNSKRGGAYYLGRISTN